MFINRWDGTDRIGCDGMRWNWTPIEITHGCEHTDVSEFDMRSVPDITPQSTRELYVGTSLRTRYLCSPDAREMCPVLSRLISSRPVPSCPVPSCPEMADLTPAPPPPVTSAPAGRHTARSHSERPVAPAPAAERAIHQRAPTRSHIHQRDPAAAGRRVSSAGHDRPGTPIQVGERVRRLESDTDDREAQKAAG